jgi:hypothetical protein
MTQKGMIESELVGKEREIARVTDQPFHPKID